MTDSLTVSNLEKRYALSQGVLHAVDDVSFEIGKGESLGLVGESGCGKSTVVRMVARLIDSTNGSIACDGKDIGSIPAKAFGRNEARRRIQVVFQDPHDSLNPHFRIFDSIADTLRRTSTSLSSREITSRVVETAEMTGLSAALLSRYPHQLSGGQKARAGIARAIVARPDILILDEPTSALDVSVQVIILRLLADLRQRLGMSYLFVSHDLNVIRLVCDRVLVMYLGKVVEVAPAQELFENPRHPYTRALLSAIPGRKGAERIRLQGEPRSPIDPSPTICRFYGRCPSGTELCRTQMPVLRPASGDHQVACHFATSTDQPGR